MTNFDQALSSIVIFQELSDPERVAIARQCTWQRYEPRSQILGHLDASTDVYFIVQGTLRVINFSLVGKEVSFRDIGPGEMFGEFAAIDGDARSANVYAITDAFLGSMTAATFHKTLQTHPAVNTAVLKSLTFKIRQMTDRVFEFSTLAVNNRIHAELLRLALAAGIEDNRSRISSAPTHAEIASRVSTHREAVTREINSLVKSEILSKENRTLIINDVARLQDAVAMKLGEFSPMPKE